MTAKFYQKGVLVVTLAEKVILLLAPEKPASPRSKRAFSEADWSEVQPPKQGYMQGAIGCQDAIVIMKALNQRAPQSKPKQLELEAQP